MIAVSCFTKNTLIVYIPILFLFDTFDLKVFSYFDHLPNASFLYFICVFRGSFNVRLLKLRIVQDRFYLICHSFIRFLLLNHIYVQIDTYFLNFTQCQMLPFCSFWCVLVSLSSIVLLYIIQSSVSRVQVISADTETKYTCIEEDITMLNYSNRCMQVLFITTIHRPRYK